jgi:hypothetical protein
VSSAGIGLAAALLMTAGLAPSAWTGDSSLASLAKEQGNGSRFKLHAQGSVSDLQVGLVTVDQSAARVIVEVFASAQLSDPLWQQFSLSLKGSKPQVEAGYIQVGRRAPMPLPQKTLAGTGNLDVGLFLLSEADLKGGRTDLKEIGPEAVTIPAGTVTCRHYQMDRPEQKLDVWISDEARPIGLVRLVSVGKKPIDNYRLELEELLSGIAAKIDPARAVPLTEDIKAFLTRP